MRPVRRPRLGRPIPLALAALALAAAACSGAALPSSGVTATTPPSPAPSQGSLASDSPSASPASAAPTASAPARTPKATAGATPRPTAKPTPKPTARPSGYQCARLLTDSEVRKATGLSDATLPGGKNGTPQESGQTSCPFTAQSGSVTVVLAVWTNASLIDFNALWNSTLPNSQQVPGIGSQAIIDAGDGVGLAIVGKAGVSVRIQGPTGVPEGVNALTSLQSLLATVATRL
jgi:hypothetical protein